MNKKISALLITIFLSVQVLSLWHMADYGFKPHKHNGSTCEIYLFCNHNNNASDIPPAIIIPVFLAFIFLAFEVFSSALCQDRRHYLRLPRAPPALSL